MDIPQELKTAIEEAMTEVKHTNLIEKSQNISEKYRKNDGNVRKKRIKNNWGYFSFWYGSEREDKQNVPK